MDQRNRHGIHAAIIRSASILFLAMFLASPSFLGVSRAQLQSTFQRNQANRERVREKVRQERERLAKEAEKHNQTIQERLEAERKKKLEEKKAQMERAAREAAQEKRPQPAGAPNPPTGIKRPQPGGGSSMETGPAVVLVHKPLSQTRRVGERFATEVVVYSDKTQAIDRIDLHVQYPEEVVRPVEVFDFPLKDLIDRDHPTKKSWEEGNLVYQADLKKPLVAFSNTPMVYILWEAIGETRAGNLSLGGARPRNGDGSMSALYLDGENVLHWSRVSGRPCVDSALVVAAPKSEKKPGLKIVRRDVEAALVDLAAEKGWVGLRLAKPDPKTVEPGDKFIIDVYLENPQRRPFDRLRLDIGFDPEKAQVLDWDYKNWIKTGVNIFDGHAHAEYPFDFLRRNEADNEKGRIVYYVGLTMPKALPTGCFARIYARALEPGAVESFTLFPEGADESTATDVLEAGRSVLESPAGQSDEALASAAR